MPDTVGDKAGRIIAYPFIILSSYSSPPPLPHPPPPPPLPHPPRLCNNFSGKIIKSVPHILKKEVNIIIFILSFNSI